MDVLDDVLDFVYRHWDFIINNLGVCASLAVLSFGIGWGLAKLYWHLYYRGQIEGYENGSNFPNWTKEIHIKLKSN